MTGRLSCIWPSIVDGDSSPDRIGVRVRKGRPGPEADLIEVFLQTERLQVPVGSRTTLFREPRLESGFPDLVAVVWREDIAAAWPSVRADLTNGDLRIMHFVHRAGRVPQKGLMDRFGRYARAAVGRLLNAGLLRSTARSWVAPPRKTVFAASQIVAIEAKIDSWGDVLDQAYLNTWFSSSSLVLVPRSPSEDRIERAKALGIGVWTPVGGYVVRPRARASALPRSYASWLLNDWAWRESRFEGGQSE